MDLNRSGSKTTIRLVVAGMLKREYLPQLERSLYTAAQRQLWIGENL